MPCTAHHFLQCHVTLLLVYPYPCRFVDIRTANSISCCIPHKEPRLAAEPDVPAPQLQNRGGHMGQDLVLASRAPGEDHIT